MWEKAQRAGVHGPDARALDKPKEQLQEIRVTGDEQVIRRLHAGRARAAAVKCDGSEGT